MATVDPRIVERPSAGYTHSARERLMHTAMRAFAARGFDGVTIRDLAQEAGVNIAAVNYHFGSKEDLHQAVMTRALSEWTSETVVIEDMTADESLAAVVAMIMSALIAPVIVRPSHPLLVRLIAWDILQGPGKRGTGMAASCCELIAKMLAPRLPSAVTLDQRLLAARWLVSQCLMLAPALAAASATSTDIIASEARAAIVARMAVAGLQAWLADLQRSAPGG